MALVRKCDFCKNEIPQEYGGKERGVVDGKGVFSVKSGPGGSIDISITVTEEVWDGGEGRNNSRRKPDICPNCLGLIVQGKDPNQPTTR